MTLGVCRTPGCGPVSDKAPRCPRCRIESPYLPAEAEAPSPGSTPPPPPAPPRREYDDDFVDLPRYDPDERLGSQAPTLTITPQMVRMGIIGVGVAIAGIVLLFWLNRAPAPTPATTFASDPILTDAPPDDDPGPQEPYETDAAGADTQVIDAPPAPENSVTDPAADSAASTTPPATTLTTPSAATTTTAPPLAPATTIPQPPPPRGFVESAIGHTLRVTAPSGVVDYFYFGADGAYTRRRGRDTSSGRWSRSGSRICVTPSGGQTSCFEDARARAVGETWNQSSGSGTASYTILRGMHYPSATSPAPPPQPVVIDNPSWIARPTPEDMQRAYPRRALERGEEGRVILDCTVIYGGRLSCRVRSETPSGHGFGEAALEVARRFRIALTQPTGASTEGALISVPIVFRVRDRDRL